MKNTQVIIYCRVSTTKQGEDGVSLEAQLQKGRDFAATKGLKVIGEFRDIASGSKDNREGMNAAVELACRTKSVFLCYSLSRLSRSTTKGIELIQRLSKCGCSFVSLTENEVETLTPHGEFLATLFFSLAALEKRQLSARTKLGLRYLRSQGFNIYSKIPYGWDLDPNDCKRLVKNEAEQKVIAQIVAMRIDGLSLGEIAQKLNSEGVLTKQSKKWGRGTLYALTKREMKSEVVAA